MSSIRCCNCNTYFQTLSNARKHNCSDYMPRVGFWSNIEFYMVKSKLLYYVGKWVILLPLLIVAIPYTLYIGTFRLDIFYDLFRENHEDLIRQYEKRMEEVRYNMYVTKRKKNLLNLEDEE